MHPSTLVMLLLLCLVVTCHALSTFDTNCPLPSKSVNLVSPPDTRGTWDIIKSSGFTLLTCTWTILHLNVPEQSERSGFWSGLWWKLKMFYMSFRWMLFTIVVPEFILGKALADLVAAYKVKKGMKSLAEIDKVEWGLAHGFYANMGGFVGFEKIGNHVQEIPLSAPQIYLLRITRVGTNERYLAGDGQVETYIKRLPEITADEIDEKSDGDMITKIITAGQVAWLAANVVDRSYQGFPISLLELTTVAFSGLTVITYGLLLYKPKGVQIPTRITCQLGSFLYFTSFKSQDAWMIWRQIVIAPWWPGVLDWFNEKLQRRIPNDFVAANFDFSTAEDVPKCGESDKYILAFGVVLGSAIFGGVHVAGWYSTFPTSTEQILWRLASILITVLPFCLLGIWALFYFPVWYISDYIFSKVFYPANYSVFTVYFLARLAISVILFRQLFYLPIDVYQIPNGIVYVPHWT